MAILGVILIILRDFFGVNYYIILQVELANVRFLEGE